MTPKDTVVEGAVLEAIKESPEIIESKDGNKILISIDNLKTALERAWEARAKDKATTLINTAVERLEKERKYYMGNWEV